MLQVVKVENLALLTEAVLDLESGFVCLTGETGAGKSLVIDALSLLSGGRASSELIRSGCERAVVEAELAIEEPPPDFDLLEGDRLFLRREIHRAGRSRAFVNGVAVPISRLAQYAALGFELHGQHGQQHLLDEKHHLDVFDQHMNLTGQVAEFNQLLAAFKDAFHTYWGLRGDEGERLKEMDILQYQIAEIERVNLSEEDEDLDARLRKARNLEEIRTTSFELTHLIDERLSPNLEVLKQGISTLGGFLPELEPYSGQIRATHTVLNELSADLHTVTQSDFGAKELDDLESRASEVNRLYLKYGKDVSQVLDELERMKGRLHGLSQADSDMGQMWHLLGDQYAKLQSVRIGLDEARAVAVKRFCQRVSQQLNQFAFSGTIFDAAFSPAPWPSTLSHSPKLELPKARMRFLIAPNPGEGLRPLIKVASGGELSRMLLALITGFDRPTEKTLVFDEVDAGISGETALKIGEKLAALGRHHQVVCVTHLAQVACFAEQHVSIQKSVRKGRTVTHLTVCDHDQRVEELARLMGGDAQAAALRDHAKTMMIQAAI